MTKLQFNCSLAAEQLLTCSIEMNFPKVSAMGRSQGFEGLKFMDGQTAIAWALLIMMVLHNYTIIY